MEKEELDKFVEEQMIKAKAEAEAKQLSVIAQDPAKSLQTKLNMKVVENIETSEQVAEKIKQSADKLVTKGLEIQEKEIDAKLLKAEKDKNRAEFELSEDDYRAFGQETAPKKNWKKKMIELGNDFWFVILYTICFFSLAPFYNYVKVIKSQSKALRFIAICVGVVLLLTCLGGITYGCLKWVGVIE